MNEYDQRYARFAAETSGWGADFMRSLRTLYGQAVALILHGIDSLRRTQVRLVVRLAPPDVADATALQARLFPEPPKDPAEAALRSSLCSLLATQANVSKGGPALQEQDWATLASVMKFLGETDREWPMRLIAPTLNRAIPKPLAPPVETASAPMVQGFLGPVGAAVGAPFAAFTGYLSMGLAVLVVLLGMWSWGLSSQLDKTKLENKQARETHKERLADNVQLREALRDTDARVGEANRAAMENAKRASEVTTREVTRRERERQMRRAEEARRAKERAENPDARIDDPDQWLRDLAAQPLLSASPVAPADAPRGAVRSHSSELPGDTGTPPGT